MEINLQQLVTRIKQRAYLDTEEIGAWIKEYAAQFHKQVLEDTWDAGKERGIHLGKCEAEGIHPDGRLGVQRLCRIESPKKTEYKPNIHIEDTRRHTVLLSVMNRRMRSEIASAIRTPGVSNRANSH